MGGALDVHRTLVLAVDDEPAVLRAFIRLARSFDVEVVTAPSGEQGLLVLERRAPDVVVSDYQLLGMDGMRFLELARRRCPRILAALHTGSGFIPPPESGVTLLPKPCDAATFAQFLGSAVVARSF